MKNKIYMKAWLDVHARLQKVDTDEWYVDFANRLLTPLTQSVYVTHEERQRVALALAMYLEDCVADAGNWREFIRWHREEYGRYLPFYRLTEEYLEDEINREDVAFLLWGFDNSVEEGFMGMENPLDEELMSLASLLYNFLDDAFEQAPVSEHLAPEWMMETELMKRKRTPLPVVQPGEPLPENVERFYAASKGEPLMFFDSYDALRLFFVQSLKWEDRDDELLPDLREFSDFVVYGNAKGLLIGPDVARYFADSRNPLYDAEATREEAYELFCEPGLCPFDLLKYGMEHGLLSEAEFPFEGGRELLHENWDFLARWFLGEYYEGE